MTTTLANLRIGLLKCAKDYIGGTVTTGTSTTVFIDAKLADKRVAPSVGQYVLFTSGNNTGQYRKITVYSSTTCQITVGRAFPYVPVVTDNFIITSFNPDDVTDAINQAGKDVYPYVCRVIDDETIVANSSAQRYTVPSSIHQVLQVYSASVSYITEDISDNGDFSEWTLTTPDHWSMALGTGTITKEEDSNFIAVGTYAARVYNTTVSNTFTQSRTDYADYAGKTVTILAHVYSLDASTVQAFVSQDSSLVNGAYHGGTGWEWITSTATVPVAPSSLSYGVYTAYNGSATRFWVDKVIVVATSRIVGSNFSPVYNWSQRGRELNAATSSGNILRLIGVGYLSTVVSDTDAMEVDSPQDELLYEYALYYLYKQMLRQMPDQTSPYIEAQMSLCEHNIDKIKRKVAISIPPVVNGVPDI